MPAKQLRIEEAIALETCQQHLNCELWQGDDNTEPGVPDIKGELRGKTIAIEVMRLWDERFESAFASLEKTDQFPLMPECRFSWSVAISKGTNLKRLTSRLPGILEQIEESGQVCISAGFWPDLVDLPFSLRKDFEELQLTFVNRQEIVGETPFAYIFMGSECVGVPRSGDELLRNFQRVLTNEGQVRSHIDKLTRTNAEFAELFFFTDSRGLGDIVHLYLDDARRTLPTVDLELPSGLTGVWFAGRHNGIVYREGFWSGFTVERRTRPALPIGRQKRER